MATINGSTIFGFTSPRTPLRMIPEIELLGAHFEGRPWNSSVQTEYMEKLVQQDFYLGNTSLKDPALSARDRINRAPKGLGFVDLAPAVRLTEPGKRLGNEEEFPETLLRQLLKFQIPSPYHTVPPKSARQPWVKPYLELLRLIAHLGRVTFDELMIYGMQLTDYRDFDAILEKIEGFRERKALTSLRYKQFLRQTFDSEISAVYREEIERGDTRTRESTDRSLAKFLKTKRSNLRDYTDAIVRYLRATQMVSISQSGRSLSIMREHALDVEFILENVPRDPVFVDDTERFKAHLFNANVPELYSDDRKKLVKRLEVLDANYRHSDKSVPEIKSAVRRKIRELKESKIESEMLAIKEFKRHDDIEDVFDRIQAGDFYDNPLMLEWNTWRAMVMLDGGQIEASLVFDDEGKPLSTAPGNQADIVCDYGGFALTVEVTLQSGQRQFDNEGEPVARHLGRLQETVSKPVYSFFIAPKINHAAVAHFYMLRRTNISLYGGRAQIVPLELATFRKMLGDGRKPAYAPEPANLLRFLEEVERLSRESEDELDWFENVQVAASRWLELAA